jgi:hypothetical protein
VTALSPLRKGEAERTRSCTYRVQARQPAKSRRPDALLASEAKPCDCSRTLFNQLHRHPGHCRHPRHVIRRTNHSNIRRIVTFIIANGTINPSAQCQHMGGDRLGPSIVDSGPPSSSHRDTVGHRGSSPVDRHSSTRQEVMRVAGLITAVRVGHRPGGYTYRDTHRNTHRNTHRGTHRDTHRATSMARARW